MGGQGRKTIIPLFSPKRYRKRCGLALSVSSQAPRQGRVAAPSVCFAAARILLAAAPTAPPCFRHWRRSSPLLPKGEPLACRSGFVWTHKVQFIRNTSAPLQRAAAAEHAFPVKLLLLLVAGHYILCHIELPSSSEKWPDMPMAPPLGELASGARLRGQARFPKVSAQR